MIVLDVGKYFGETTGGIRTYLLEKAAWVRAHAGFRHVIVVPAAEDSVTDEGSVRWYRLRSPRIPTDPQYRFFLHRDRLAAILAAERPDLVEVGSPFFVPWVARAANRRHAIPMTWFYHSHLPDVAARPGEAAGPLRRSAGALAWRYVRRVSRLFHATLAASGTTGEALVSHGVANVRRVTLGVDLVRFTPSRAVARAATRAALGLPEGLLAIYVGRAAREKRLDVVLDGWPEVAGRTGATLCLIGHGAEGRHPAVPGVRWLPYQADRDRLADLLAAADCAVAPGPTETFGLSALEAMASGLPVLSVDRGAVAERVAASGAGALYPAGSPLGFRDAALRLFGDDLPALGARGRAWAEAHHDWDTAFQRIFAVYGDVLGR